MNIKLTSQIPQKKSTSQNYFRIYFVTQVLLDQNNGKTSLNAGWGGGGGGGLTYERSMEMLVGKLD